MHGLINKSLQSFIRDTYGLGTWISVANQADIDPAGFEAMLTYEDKLTDDTLNAASAVLEKPRDSVLEDLGTYLVSHPNVEPIRRLLRFGGPTFTEFLHSLDELPERARLAVPDLDLPEIELCQTEDNSFQIKCAAGVPGFGHVLVGLLRCLADDYGTLAFLECIEPKDGAERVSVRLIEDRFAVGRRFDLASGA